MADPYPWLPVQGAPPTWYSVARRMLSLVCFGTIIAAAQLLIEAVLFVGWMLALVCYGTILNAAQLLTQTDLFVASMLALGCCGTICAAAQLLTQTDLFVGWMLPLGCYGTFCAAAGFYTLIESFLIDRMIPVDRPIAGQDQAIVRWKLRNLGSRYMANTIDLFENTIDLLEKIVRSLSLSTLRGIKMRMKGGSSFGRSILLVAGLLSFFPAVGADTASEPGSSTSGKPSFYQIMSVVGVIAGVLAMLFSFIFGCLGIYYHWIGRGGGARGVAEELTRPLREHVGGLYMAVGSLEDRNMRLTRYECDSRQPSAAYGSVHELSPIYESSPMYESSPASGSADELSLV